MLFLGTVGVGGCRLGGATPGSDPNPSYATRFHGSRFRIESRVYGLESRV